MGYLMAEAIGFAILGQAVGGTVLFGTVTAAAVTGTVVLTAASVAASYAAQTLMAQKPRRERQQATFNEAMGPRRFIYGQALVGGTRAFWDSRQGELHQCIMLCSHEIDSIAEYWVGDVRVDTDLGTAGGNVSTYPMTGKVFFEPYLGTADQAAATLLRARYPEVWSVDHRLRGIAHVCVSFGGVKKDDQSKVFPQGAYTQLRFGVKGKKIFDPSLGTMDPENPATWAWGDNSGDVILDYLRSADGYRRPLSQIDLPSFEDFHAHCAENVPRADGSPVGRYRTWGAVGFDEEPQAALARLHSACDGIHYQGPTGKIGIRHGGWTGPLINISTRHITGAALTQGNDKLGAYNRLKVSYTDPDNYYQATELTARDDLASQAQIGIVEEVRDLSMVPDWTQAARIAKIMMAEDNPLWKGTIATDLMPLDALIAPAVDITYDPVPDGVEPLMNAPCKIGSLTLRGDLSGCDLGFSAVPASAREWNAATEQPPRPITPTTILAVNLIPDPTGLVLSVDRPAISGDIDGVRLSLSWSASSRDDVIPEAQYSIAGAGSWSPMSNVDNLLSAFSPLISDGGSYDVRVRFVVGSASSGWSAAGPIDAISDVTPPGPPTGFVANGGVGQVMVAWTAPNSENVRSTRLYRASSGAGFGSAVVVANTILSANQAFDAVESGLSPGNYDYWVRALNRGGFGDVSSTAGPVTATVT